MTSFANGLCNDTWRSYPRQPDADSFYLHCTGGFRAAKFTSEQWIIEPVFEHGEVRSKGFLNRSQIGSVLEIGEYKRIGFQSCSWIEGAWHSSWHPVMLSQKNNLLNPAGIWGNIAANIFRNTRGQKIKQSSSRDYLEIFQVIDDCTIEERLAQAISLSLRSMDFSMQQIVDFYHEQLVNILHKADRREHRFSTTMDQALFSHVHAFFLQIGAARDYLAAFIANRLKMDASHGRIDTLRALKNELRECHLGKEPILDLIIRKGFLIRNPENPQKWVTGGWLKDMTDLRNQIVHRRPYGSVQSERFGWIIAQNEQLGLYRYFRPIEIDKAADRDLLDFLSVHYMICCEFFFEAANLARLDTSILHITDDDLK